MEEMGASIGSINDEPQPASAQRLRTILPGIVAATEAAVLRDHVDGWIRSLASRETEATRLTVRAVVEDGALNALRNVEATVPLGDGRSLVYLGANLPERSLSETDSARLDAVAKTADANHGEGGGPNFEKITARLTQATARGYAIEVAASDTERAVLAQDDGKAIARLLARFGYDLDESLAVLTDPTNLVGTARTPDGVVGVVVLESAEIPLDEGAAPLRIAELTDSSVDDDHVGYGLQLVIHAHLIAALVDGATPPDLIFSESGYTASLFNAASLGRRFCGRLPNHAHIGDVASLALAPTAYQSLEVTTLDRYGAAALIAELRREGLL
jgi:hypothetical protein